VDALKDSITETSAIVQYSEDKIDAMQYKEDVVIAA
jgi:hypothetical protein